MVRSALILVCFIWFFFSCDSQKKQPDNKNEIKHYLFLGHVYDDSPPVDDRITPVFTHQFDAIWLGGDISYNASDSINLEYLEELFHIKSDSTFWALGNHDISFGNRMLKYMDKPAYSTHFFNRITLVVLNTNDQVEGNCSQINDQLAMVQSVCDSIQQSSHLIILSHFAPWGAIDSCLQMKQKANTDISKRVFQCDPYATFDEVLYPELVKVKQKGIQPIFISGDFGQKQSTFEWQSPEGIVFLGQGMLSNTKYNQEKFKRYSQSDSILVFKHDISNKRLEWKFLPFFKKS